MPKHKIESFASSQVQANDNHNHRHQHNHSHRRVTPPTTHSTLDSMQQELDCQAPPAKRLRVPHLNFSIESMMQPASQQQHQINSYLGQHHHLPSTKNHHSTSTPKRRASNGAAGGKQQQQQSVVLSRSPSPAGSDVSSASNNSSRSSSTSRSSNLSTPDSNKANNNNNNSNIYNNQNVSQHAQHHLTTTNDSESLASSSRSSSRAYTPISPGCNSSGARGAGDLMANSSEHHQHHHFSTNNTQHQHQSQQHNSTPRNHQMVASSSSSGRTHVSSKGSSTAAANNAASCAPNSRLNQVECVLDNKDMWDKFHSLNTEMIITKTGRRMFPVLKVQFHNLDPNARYAVSMDIVPVDNKRYRYAYHKSCWQVAGKADPSAEPRLYPHPDSPFNGDLLSRQVISFEKVKLTNNEMDKSGHIILNSMHKYQPRVHLIELKSTLPPQSQMSQSQAPLPQALLGGGKLPGVTGSTAHSRIQQINQQTQQQQRQPQPQLDIEGYRTFVFSETVFTAVTAYQNQLITKMKIDKNPFAKGFRDSSRLSDLDRNDPFDYMSSLGPAAAAAAAAAACAAGRFPPGAGLGMGGPGGGPPTGSGGPPPPGSLEAAAAAAAAVAGLPPGHASQMDQAYAQLLAASAAAAQSPWYPAGAAPSPFGPGSMMGGGAGGSPAAACSTAQAAQAHLQTQLWLAAFSACLNNGAQPNPSTPLIGPTPPPPLPGGGMHQINSNLSSPAADLMTASQHHQQQQRGDSRNSG